MLRRLASLFVMHLERLKGDHVFVQAPCDQTNVSHLVGHALTDYEIHIYCQRKQYWRLYTRWTWWKRSFVVYRVFSVVSGEAPLNVVSACTVDVDIPAQLPFFVEENLQRMKAVNAYLDLVLARLVPA